MPAMRVRALERFHSDVEAAARLAGVGAVCPAARAGFDAYREFFSGSAVSFRTSTCARKPASLNVRYVELARSVDPYPAALAHDLLSPDDHPIYKLLDEAAQRIPILGYGVDIGVSTGLEKIWPFFPHQPQTISSLSKIDTLPRSILQNADYLARHGFDDARVLAIDYRNRTVNLYFMRPPELFPSTAIHQMITDLGFAAPKDEVLRHCTLAVPFYLTFNWESPVIERICFGVIAPNRSHLPIKLHPLIDHYSRNAPFAVEKRIFIYSIAVTKSEVFFKIENDYSGTMTALMQPS